MTLSVAPIQPVSGKKDSGKKTLSGQHHAQQGFAHVLEELSNQYQPPRQDGFSPQEPRHQLSTSEQDIDLLQRRIMQVNRILLSFLPSSQ